MYDAPPKQGFGFGRNQPPFDDDFFSLGAPVGPGQPNRREDVIKVETILGNTGHHDLAKTDGPLGWWSDRQESAVKAWQGENGLKVDGLLKPNGPTITSLKQAAGGLLGGFKPPSPGEVDEHHGRLAQGEPGILNTRPARLSIRVPEQPPELDEQTLAFNADSARALTRTSVDGDMPNIYGNYLKQAGADGHTTVLDLVEQVNNSQGRDRAERVLHGILGQVPPDQAKAFLGGEMPTRRPIGVHMAALPDDDKAPLFARAAAGPKMDAMAAAKGPAPGGSETVTETPIETDPAPAQAQGEGPKPVQVAAAPAAIPLLPLLMGGAAVTGGAIAQQQIQQQMNKPQGNSTTVADPQSGKPQVLTGPDPSKPQTQQGTPPSQPPKPVPPIPPSTPQNPPAGGNSYPGRPAEPVKPMEPLEIRKRPPVNLGKGGKPYQDTEDAIAGIPDKKAQDTVRGVMLGSGVTNGADKSGTHVVVEDGDFETGKQDHGKLVQGLGIDPASVRKRQDGGLEATSPDGRAEIIVRPSSSKDEPTLEVQTKDEKGNVTHRFKRRYGRQDR